MIHFWQRDRSSVENSATFRTQTCIGCHRSTHPVMVPPARPICIMPSYDEAEIKKHITEGQPYLDTLPEWDPVGCSELFPVIEPVMRFTMNDNEANPIVHDVRGVYDQTFADATGDPNTNAHTAAGHIGTALAFDGVDDYIEIDHDSWTPYFEAGKNWSFCYWFYRPYQVSPPTNFEIGNQINVGAGFVHYRSATAGRAHMCADKNGTKVNLDVTTMGITTNTWLFAAFVKGSTSAKIYLGSVAKGTSNSNNWAGKCYVNTNNLCIAKHCWGPSYSMMRYDDVRLYNYALTAAQVAALAAM